MIRAVAGIVPAATGTAIETATVLAQQHRPGTPTGLVMAGQGRGGGTAEKGERGGDRDDED
jgi:hypothetical protein